MNLSRRVALTAMVLFAAGDASAATTCTLVIDAATNATLIRVGDRCDERLTPASTFKIPLSLIGFDSGILVDAGADRSIQGSGAPGFDGKTALDIARGGNREIMVALLEEE